MTDEEFTAAVERLEGDRTGQFGVKVAREAIRRLEDAKATLRQIGWTHNDGKFFISFNFTDEQAGVLAKALEHFRYDDKRSIEEKVTQIFAAWIKCPENMKGSNDG